MIMFWSCHHTSDYLHRKKTEKSISYTDNEGGKMVVIIKIQDFPLTEVFLQTEKGQNGMR